MLRFCRWINFCLHLPVARGVLGLQGEDGREIPLESIWDRILSGVILEAHHLLLISGEMGRKLGDWEGPPCGEDTC